METDVVKDLLKKFQDGYTRRDQSHLDEFMDLFIPSDELEIIGTDAVEVGKGEWCLGREAARELVSRDWEHWGDVAYDLENARIFVKGEVAWIATTGTVTDFIPNEDRYNGFVGYAKSVAEEDGVDARKKMLDIIGLGNDLMVGIFLGEKCVWPFRFTAVAVKEKGRWLFHQLNFSFATTRAPDVRIQ